VEAAEFVVRRLRPDEGQRLKEIRLRALADAPLAFLSTFDAEVGRSDEVWDGLARRWSEGDAEATFVAAAHDHSLVGLIGSFIEDDRRSAHLVSMWTAPEARRRGVATALVESVSEWAGAAGAVDLHLWVARGNQPAIRLYQSAGFHALPDFRPHPNDPCREELRMARPLRVRTAGSGSSRPERRR
jgi:ribosomal protein S18 acetylase RimI-like enzyme